MRYSIGVDLGGTKTEAVLLEEEREIARLRRPTPKTDGYDAVVRSTVAIVIDVARERAISPSQASIGVGMPGGVERRTGRIKNSNTTCLNGRPFREDVAGALGCAVAFENDANCFALAEARLGAARAHRDGVVFGVILGTGVGGGFVLAGQLWSGPHGIAGEWGHHAVAVDGVPEVACYCGRRRCLETILSGPALEGRYRALGGEALALDDIVVRRQDDPRAAIVVAQMVEAFGRALANVIDILDPSAVVLGGGVPNVDLLYDEGRARVAELVFNDELTTPILRHSLGDSAGVLGAALLGAAQRRDGAP